MRHITVAAAGAVLAIGLGGASAQEMRHGESSQMREQHMMAMMKDSAMVEMMMDHIAASEGLRRTMMLKMLSHAESDSVAMNDLCRTMMDDGCMDSCMMKMKDGGHMKHEGMMHHEMMHGESSGTKAPDRQKREHEGHH